jgi:Ni/Co efflux regulator RcnB
MKKIASVMLGLAFVLGTVAFAQDAQSSDKMAGQQTTKTKKHKTKKHKKASKTSTDTAAPAPQK